MLIASSVPHGIMPSQMRPDSIPRRRRDPRRRADRRHARRRRGRLPRRGGRARPITDPLARRTPERRPPAHARGSLGVAAGASVKLVTVTPANAGRGLPDHSRPRRLARCRDREAAGADRRRDADRDAHRGRIRRRHPAARPARCLDGCAHRGRRPGRVAVARGARRAADPPRARVTPGTRTARRAFAERMAELTGIAVEAADTAEAAVRESDVICCATTSAEPVFEASWVSAGTHVNGIGAYRLGMVEIPPELFGLASRRGHRLASGSDGGSGRRGRRDRARASGGGRPRRDRQRRRGLGGHPSGRRDHRLQIGRAGHPGRRRG